MIRTFLLASLTVLCLIAASVGVLIAQGTFYTTGGQWFAACADPAAMLDTEVNPRGSGGHGRSCDDLANVALWASGVSLAPGFQPPRPAVEKVLDAACPTLRRMQEVGPSHLIADSIKAAGGPHLIDNFLPAEAMLRHAWSMAYPTCLAELKHFGLVHMYQLPDGSFSFTK